MRRLETYAYVPFNYSIARHLKCMGVHRNIVISYSCKSTSYSCKSTSYSCKSATRRRLINILTINPLKGRGNIMFSYWSMYLEGLVGSGDNVATTSFGFMGSGDNVATNRHYKFRLR